MTDSTSASARCRDCGTHVAPATLSCPACRALVHRDRLQLLASEAAQQSSRGELVQARESWQSALTLLPASSQQHADIGFRIAALDSRIAAGASADSGAARSIDPARPGWKRWLAPVGAVLVLVVGKLKFLLLGLSKASTLFSMLAFFGVYWTQFGWPLAAGLALSIYVHEMGHVAALHRFGVPASAPFFIPGIGAVVRLRQQIQDASVNAMVGLAGPLWGLAAAVAAWCAYLATGLPIWGAIAHLGAYVNLFNLLPVWQLDGARGMDALNQWQRVVVTAVIGATFAATHEKLLVIIGAVALYRALRPAERKGDLRMTALFSALVVALGFMATVRV